MFIIVVQIMKKIKVCISKNKRKRKRKEERIWVRIAGTNVCELKYIRIKIKFIN